MWTHDLAGRETNCGYSFCDDEGFPTWGRKLGVVVLDHNTIVVQGGGPNGCGAMRGLYGRMGNLTSEYIHWWRLNDQPSESMLKVLIETRCWIAAKAAEEEGVKDGAM